jgi:hypothetical protein
MRFHRAAAILILLLSTLAACVPQVRQQQQTATHPNLIIVRDFDFSTGAITLDPSFGFSLYRGHAGVPPHQRAASVGRATAFNVADATTQQLAALGYDVVRSETATAAPGARAIIVSGAFRHINEGHRRRVGAENASVAVDVEIDQQSGGGKPQRITSFDLDSRRIPRSLAAISTRRGANVAAAAKRVGDAVAAMVAETARLNHWPAASR